MRRCRVPRRLDRRSVSAASARSAPAEMPPRAPPAILRHVPAGRAEFVGDFVAEDVGVDRRTSGRSDHPISRASDFSRAPNEQYLRCRCLPARRRSRAKCELSRLSSAAPPDSIPAKISALASAMASMPAKNSRCTGSTVVMIATCGRTIFVSGVDFARMIHADLEDAKRVSPGSAPATAARPSDC